MKLKTFVDEILERTAIRTIPYILSLQMAIEEHHVLGMLGPRRLRPTMNLRPGVGRVFQRLLKGSKFSQFKIEPLLNREAPNVEVSLVIVTKR